MMPKQEQSFEEWFEEYQRNKAKAARTADSDLWHNFSPLTVRGKAAEAKRKASRPPAPHRTPPSSLVWRPGPKAGKGTAEPPPPVTRGEREIPMARILELRPAKAMGTPGAANTEPMIVELQQGQPGAPANPVSYLFRPGSSPPDPAMPVAAGLPVALGPQEPKQEETQTVQRFEVWAGDVTGRAASEGPTTKKAKPAAEAPPQPQRSQSWQAHGSGSWGERWSDWRGWSNWQGWSSQDRWGQS